MPDVVSKPDWGLLPDAVDKIIRKREWENPSNLKALLLGKRVFPIKVSLKPPAGRTAISNVDHFRRFIASWQTYPEQKLIEWESRSYRDFSKQNVPRNLVIKNIQTLIDYLGGSARQKSQIWQRNMAPLLSLRGDGIYSVLIKYLVIVESMSEYECNLLRDLCLQLSPEMGVNKYLRALPLVGVDTKFLEINRSIVSDLLDVMYNGELTKAGGLHHWLGCLENPKGWLFVRPLCSMAKSKLGGFPILRLSNDGLMQHELPASNVLIVENVQSGLALPDLEDTVAVFGGGRNIKWMDSDWLKTKKVAYWGDIDSWGLTILSEARSKLPHLTALMMDEKTLQKFENRMVNENESIQQCPPLLNGVEQLIFYGLKSGEYKFSRLEQERISSDYIARSFAAWLSS
ncbi:MAG: hypothetical protein ACI845_003196 [Gammaproteobacteria bacterium]|jgi:hypothetical protein